MRAVKGYVLLAIVLLIPAAGYYHKQHFQRRLAPQLAASVMGVLQSEGVENPGVEMNYLDAVITGRVASEETRAVVAARVDALPGVRVPAPANRLQTYGWIRISRADGLIRGQGKVPAEYGLALPEALGEHPGWDDEVERRETVEMPRTVGDWHGFLTYYFGEAGDRSVELREGKLVLRGDATKGLSSDWLSKASEVVEKDQVAAEFVLYPSVYHFPGYRPRSLDDEERVAELRRQLGDNLIEFGEGDATAVPESERGKIAAIARAILQAGVGVRCTVGGHPERDGNATANSRLAKARATEVLNLLAESGADAAQLRIGSFGATDDRARENRVEVVVE